MSDKNVFLPEKSGYRIIRQLGSGGDGTVYLVCHLNTEQLRAAKILTNVRSDRRHELNMMKHLNHPGLPRVIDLLEQDDSLWLIMEYIQGERLDQEVARGISDERILAVGCQLAEILMYLHSRNPPVLHLDIKPSNILVRPDKRLVLIDFGASIRGHPSGEQDKRYGTRGFAAPEQRKKGECVDERTDIFGVGAVMYYCYYRRVPDEQALRSRTPEHKEVSLRKKRLSSGRQIDKVIRNCLAGNPALRYQNSQQLYKAVCHASRVDRCCRQLYKVAGSMVLLILSSMLLAETFSREQLVNGMAGQSDTKENLLQIQEKEESEKQKVSEEQEESEAQKLSEEQEESETQKVSEEQEYQRLLAMAGGMGFSQAVECYQKAAFLFPADGDWYLQLVEQVTRDGLFDVEEETIVKDLIYTVQPDSGVTALELLKTNREAYGRFAYRLGLAYWYFYEESGGKSAAAWWLQLALSAQDEGETWEWTQTAEVLAKIGSYYGMIGSTGSSEEREAKEWDYWKDLKTLWYLYRENQENSLVRAEAALELCSFLILKSYVLCQNGETKENALQLIESIGEFAESGSVADDKKQEKLLEQYTAAQQAIERTFQGQEESEK